MSSWGGTCVIGYIGTPQQRQNKQSRSSRRVHAARQMKHNNNIMGTTEKASAAYLDPNSIFASILFDFRSQYTTTLRYEFRPHLDRANNLSSVMIDQSARARDETADNIF